MRIKEACLRRKKMKKMITIKDIAERAGVAKSTVSNVFSNKKYVSPEIKERVMRICKELDFQPNFYAASLSNKQNTNLIGLFLEAGEYLPFYNDLMKAILIESAKNSYNVIVYYGLNNDEIHNKIMYGRSPIDGAILLSPSFDDERINSMQMNMIPSVIIGRPDQNIPCSTIDTDNKLLVKEVVKKIIDGNGMNIFMINSNEKLTISNDRKLGFKEAMNLSEEEIEKRIFYSKQSTKEDGYYFAIKSIKQNCDAIITASEKIALGVYEACNDLNKIIGKDVKVFSLGYSSNISFNPGLACATQDYLEIGEKSVKLLIEKINNPTENKNILVKSNIYYNESLEN